MAVDQGRSIYKPARLMLDMRHTRTVHCVPAGKIKPEMRDGKYVYTEPSRGPRTLLLWQRDPDEPASLGGACDRDAGLRPDWLSVCPPWKMVGRNGKRASLNFGGSLTRTIISCIEARGLVSPLPTRPHEGLRP